MLKTILASLTGTASDRTVLDASIAVARAFGSHVECLHVKYGPSMGLAPFGSQTSWEIERHENKRSERAHTAFEEAFARSGLPSRETDARIGAPSLVWHEIPGLDLNETPFHGRHHDLVIAGRDDELVSTRIPEIVLSVGRPVLVPAARPSNVIGRKIAVAWKPGPESARAMTAAAPLISKADKLCLMSVVEGDTSESGQAADLKELANKLQWNGVESELLVLPRTEAGVGETLKSAAYNSGADLLVIGAYGHSRLREFVLGGVTRSVIGECEIPALLFH